MVETYEQATRGARALQMTGVSRLGPLLAAVHSMAPPYAPQSPVQQYSVLLLVLAGPPGDVDALDAALEELADLPLLVVAIGVGSADFSALQVPAHGQPDHAPSWIAHAQAACPCLTCAARTVSLAAVDRPACRPAKEGLAAVWLSQALPACSHPDVCSVIQALGPSSGSCQGVSGCSPQPQAGVQALATVEGRSHRTLRFCHMRTDEHTYSMPPPPAENPWQAQLADVPLLPRRLLHELPFRIMQALEAAGAAPLAPRPAPAAAT